MQRPNRESEVGGESLISQEALLVKPGVRLSTLCLKTQPAIAVCPLISYPGKILPLESKEYRFGVFFSFLRYFELLEGKLVTEMGHGREELVSSPQVCRQALWSYRGMWLN